MRLLVVHQNFPGQFGHLVREWAQRPGWEVRALARDAAPGLPGFEGLMRYRLARNVRAAQHPYLRQMEAATLHGQAVARSLLQLRRQGFMPDVILAHPGWGETLYAKDVYPNARLIHLCEWYYQADGADLNFDPEFPLSFDDRARIRTWNALHTLNLTNCDAGVAPTQWQLVQHPALFRPKITVQHEGIPCHALGPDATAQLTLPNGTTLQAGDPVVTYVARNLEPYRGFHVFMRMLEQLQRLHRHCHAIIVGGDDVSYGRRPVDARHWRERMLRDVKVDPSRTHFLGSLPCDRYRRVLQLSAAHVYLTYPFVLSWSLLEAMASGAPIVASNTAPVREVIRNGVNGRLVDFFDPRALAEAAMATLSCSDSKQRATQARLDSRSYSHAKGITGYERLFCATSNTVTARTRNSAEHERDTFVCNNAETTRRSARPLQAALGPGGMGSQ